MQQDRLGDHLLKEAALLRGVGAPIFSAGAVAGYEHTAGRSLVGSASSG